MPPRKPRGVALTLPLLFSSLQQSGYYTLKADIEFIQSHAESEQWLCFQLILFSDAEPKRFSLGDKSLNSGSTGSQITADLSADFQRSTTAFESTANL